MVWAERKNILKKGRFRLELERENFVLLVVGFKGNFIGYSLKM